MSGIKYIGVLYDVMLENENLGTGYKHSLEVATELFHFINGIIMVCGCLTLHNFVNTFPITKDYDGEMYGNKDYFYTMKILYEMDWDKPIGKERISKLLWDYENNDLQMAYFEYMDVMSDIHKFQTGKGIAEEWCDKMDIPTYTVNEDRGYIRDN